MNYTIETLPAFRMCGMKRNFNSETRNQIPDFWGEFVPRMHEVQKIVGTTTYGACTAENEAEQHGGGFTYIVAFEVEADAPVPTGMDAFDVPEQKYAKFTFDGHISGFPAFIDDVWCKAMPESGLTIKHGISFERYDDRWIPETGLGPVDYFIPIE